MHGLRAQSVPFVLQNGFMPTKGMARQHYGFGIYSSGTRPVVHCSEPVHCCHLVYHRSSLLNFGTFSIPFNWRPFIFLLIEVADIDIAMHILPETFDTAWEYASNTLYYDEDTCQGDIIELLGLEGKIDTSDKKSWCDEWGFVMIVRNVLGEVATDEKTAPIRNAAYDELYETSRYLPVKLDSDVTFNSFAITERRQKIHYTIFPDNHGIDGNGLQHPWFANPRLDLVYPEYILMVPVSSFEEDVKYDWQDWIWNGIQSEQHHDWLATLSEVELDLLWYAQEFGKTRIDLYNSIDRSADDATRQDDDMMYHDFHARYLDLFPTGTRASELDLSAHLQSKVQAALRKGFNARHTWRNLGFASPAPLSDIPHRPGACGNSVAMLPQHSE